MLFTELLTKHGVDRKGVSAGIQTKMKQYDRFQKAVNEAKERLTKSTITATTKANLEKEIVEGEENMVKLNDDICTRIDNYIANKETNDKKAAALLKARNSKGQGGAGAAAATQQTKPLTVEEVAGRIAKGEKLSDPVYIEFYTNNKAEIEAELVKIKEEEELIAHQPITTKKKSSVGKIIGWTLGIGTVIALAILGVKEMNKNKL